MAGKLMTIPGRFEASGAEGKYDRALLDMDSDGTFEKTVPFANGMFGPSENRFNFTFPLDIGEMKFKIEMHGPLADPVKGPVYLYWTLRNEENHFFFNQRQGRALRLGREGGPGQGHPSGPPLPLRGSVQHPGARRPW